MESINECFLLEKELRGVVQKGMRGNVGAVEYLEEVRSGAFPPPSCRTNGPHYRILKINTW